MLIYQDAVFVPGCFSVAAAFGRRSLSPRPVPVFGAPQPEFGAHFWARSAADNWRSCFLGGTRKTNKKGPDFGRVISIHFSQTWPGWSRLLSCGAA